MRTGRGVLTAHRWGPRLPPLWTRDPGLPGRRRTAEVPRHRGPRHPRRVRRRRGAVVGPADRPEGRRRPVVRARGHCRRLGRVLGGAVPAGMAGRSRHRGRDRWRRARRRLWPAALATAVLAASDRRPSANWRPSAAPSPCRPSFEGPPTDSSGSLRSSPSRGYCRCSSRDGAGPPSPERTTRTALRSASRSWWPWASSPPASPPCRPPEPGRCGRPGRGCADDHPRGRHQRRGRPPRRCHQQLLVGVRRPQRAARPGRTGRSRRRPAPRGDGPRVDQGET